MRKLISLLTLTLVLVSCGTDGSHFKIEGRFLNLNQGEFYVYSIDGGSAAIDTIRINGGRFAYEIDCAAPQTFMLVFPNFSEQPLFAEPGKSVDIKADASHLKEMEVKGNTDNELMTKFRKQIANASPPEAAKQAAQFINDNPNSRVSTYLLRRYFIQTLTPDYKQALQLVEGLLKKQPDNGQLINMRKDIQSLRNSETGNKLPPFTAYDTKGNTVSQSLLSGKVSVINVWASWNFESQNAQRQLKKLKKQYGSRLELLSICLDASKRDCNQTTDRDSITWANVCDGMLFESPLVSKLGIRGVPDNIIIDRTGKVVAHGLTTNDLLDRIKQML